MVVVYSSDPKSKFAVVFNFGISVVWGLSPDEQTVLLGVLEHGASSLFKEE